MVKRLILGVVMGVSLLAGTAAAQQSPPVTQPPVVTTTPPPTVFPTTIVAPTTTVAVAPTTIEQKPTTTVTVRGVVINRPLPRTGNDFGVQVVAGLALTAAGLALAITARLRRQRLLGPAA